MVMLTPNLPGRAALRAGAILALAALLTACATPHRPAYEPVPVPAPAPEKVPPARPGPVIAPPPVERPPAPSRPTTQPSHPRYAPPPHVAAHWDNTLGVYVVPGRDLFYRERLYYRHQNGWLCAPHPDGPWEPVALPSVPPGLRNR
ncbi:hypothetical protein [Stutzerimonas tarimensis]|uniref:Lipoprotein n=1 Tax=Stutzerimonas tarimensis TaxID=1507735 RepID=A0ABV7TB51_9GAMM